MFNGECQVHLLLDISFLKNYLPFVGFIILCRRSSTSIITCLMIIKYFC